MEVYHRRPSQEGDQTPIQRWEGGGFLPHMPDSLERLDLLLMYAVRPRKVRRDGIHFERLRYLSPVLAAYVGEEVTVRLDPRDMGEVRVFYRDTSLLGGMIFNLDIRTTTATAVWILGEARPTARQTESLLSSE